MPPKRVAIAAIAIVLLLCVVGYAAAPGIIESRFNKVLHRPPYSASEQAKKLHATLIVADLHADSLLWQRDLRRRSSLGHVDLPRLHQGNVALQAFTVVTQAPKGINIDRNSNATDLIKMIAIAEHWPPRTWNSRAQRALYQAGRLRDWEQDAANKLTIIRSSEDLTRCIEEHRGDQQRVCGLLGAEGAQALDGNLENLQVFFDAGFRMMSPSHFTDTDIGGSAAGVTKGGLTAKGREWVRLMESKKMVIDLAHASPATLRDVTAMATRPVVVSHTGVRGTCNNNRNLSDDELREVAKTGGVVGIGYWDTATCGTNADAIARAIRYTVGVIGVEHVGLGSDFDGGTTEPFDATGTVQITDALLRTGFSDDDIRLIIGGNTVRVLTQLLPN